MWRNYQHIYNKVFHLTLIVYEHYLVKASEARHVTMC